jgi:predicted nuclease of predicted toxin-antitoxin system
MKILLDMNLSPRWRELLGREHMRSDNLDPDVMGPNVIAALRQLEKELGAGALVSVNPQRTRMRLLPLPPQD